MYAHDLIDVAYPIEGEPTDNQVTLVEPNEFDWLPYRLVVDRDNFNRIFIENRQSEPDVELVFSTVQSMVRGKLLAVDGFQQMLYDRFANVTIESGDDLDGVEPIVTPTAEQTEYMASMLEKQSASELDLDLDAGTPYQESGDELDSGDTYQGDSGDQTDTGATYQGDQSGAEDADTDDQQSSEEDAGDQISGEPAEFTDNGDTYQESGDQQSSEWTEDAGDQSGGTEEDTYQDSGTEDTTYQESGDQPNPDEGKDLELYNDCASGFDSIIEYRRNDVKDVTDERIYATNQTTVDGFTAELCELLGVQVSGSIDELLVTAKGHALSLIKEGDVDKALTLFGKFQNLFWG